LSGASDAIDGLSANNAGSYNIGAAYSGDGSNFSGAGATTVNIEKATPNISVSCSPNPIVYGGANSICSIYASLNGAVTGTVSLVIDGAAWTTLALSSGSATAQFPSSFGIGTFTVGATYNGDFNNNTSGGFGTVTVEEATPTLAVSTSGTPSTYGRLVTFTATVSSGPTGTVTFYDGGSFIGTGTISGTTTTLSTSALLAGSHSISASWAGNSDFTGATSSAITQTVMRASVAINSASTLSPSVYGDNVAWTFTVTGSGITPTGTVTVSDGANTLATISLNAGIATYDTSALVAGSHTLTAVYSGDNNYQ
jgi:hypothetical protein